jgi:hypothetical protein
MSIFAQYDVNLVDINSFFNKFNNIEKLTQIDIEMESVNIGFSINIDDA